jgi:hypothetical protein
LVRAAQAFFGAELVVMVVRLVPAGDGGDEPKAARPDR